MMRSESGNSRDIVMLEPNTLGPRIGTGHDSRVYRVGDVVVKLYDEGVSDPKLLREHPLTDVSDLQEYQETASWYRDYLDKNPCTGELYFSLPGEEERTSFRYDFSVVPILAVGRFGGIPAAVSEYVPGPNLLKYIFADTYEPDLDLSEGENSFLEQNRDQVMEEYHEEQYWGSSLKKGMHSMCQVSEYATSFLHEAWRSSGVSIAYVNVKLGVDLDTKKLHFRITDLYGNFRKRRSY